MSVFLPFIICKNDLDVSSFELFMTHISFHFRYEMKNGTEESQGKTALSRLSFCFISHYFIDSFSISVVIFYSHFSFCLYFHMYINLILLVTIRPSASCYVHLLSLNSFLKLHLVLCVPFAYLQCKLVKLDRYSSLGPDRSQLPHTAF